MRRFTEMKNLEQELKLQLTSAEYRALCDLTAEKPRLQTNYYFQINEPRADFAMVRIREKEGNFLLCYKSSISNREGVWVNDERECELEKTFAENLISRGISEREINAMLKTDFHQRLEYAGKLDTYRTTFFLQNWKLELDKNFYLDFCDYELECECESVESLESLKEFLRQNYGVEIRYSAAKSARFFQAKNLR